LALGLFRRAEPPPSTNRGERIYAIGDIHGRLDLLTDLLARVEAHSRGLPEPESLYVVLLGDLVDRGPQSAEVLAHVHALQKQSDAFLVLKGNHEQLMYRALDGERGVMQVWLRTGGAETLESYGLARPEPGTDPEAFLAEARRAVPPAILRWLRALPLTARSGDYFFCHAGVRPGVPLRRQSQDDLLWIRSEFLHDPSRHGAMVVHGHSISDGVEMLPNRIGVDTGAYRTGVLSALYLEGTDRAVIATG
jgi:serine/threonine protein phosphatase 1